MKFKSPLGISNLFWTPSSYEELEKRCLDYSGNERVIALTTMAYTINMCAKAVDDELTRQQAEADKLTNESDKLTNEEFLDIMRNYG